MSGFNGSGTYVRGYNWVNDAAASINITASRVDADMLDVVNGFNLCVTRDGQGKISADFDFNNLSGKNLASGSAGTPSLRFNSDATHGIFLVTSGTIGWSGNMQFSNTGSIVSADMSNATITSRLAFQDKTAGNTTSVMAIPNGVGASAAWWAFNNSIPTNAAYSSVGCDATSAFHDSNVTGSGTQLPLAFRVAGTEAARFAITTRNFLIGQTADGGQRFQVTAASGNDIALLQINEAAGRSLVISNTNAAGGTAFVCEANNNGVQGQFIAATGGVIYLGSISAHPLLFLTGNAERARFDNPNGGNFRLAVGAYTATSAVVAAATTTINCQLSNVFRVSMGTNITTLTVSNPSDGQTINMRFKQDGTGSRTIAWPASFKWAGGSAPALSTAASAEDFVAAQYDATDATWAASMLKSLA